MFLKRSYSLETMKITLNNFRCYRGEHVFEFQDTGLTLLCGASGMGKSTILNAILFVIQGVGNGTKNIADGETMCRVTIVFDIFEISRSCRPNRLVYKNLETFKEYEDDDAQERVRAVFGHRFEYISYIQQQSQKSFLSLSPAEKLEVFEDIIFHSHDLEKTPTELKKQCNIQIKQLTSEYDKTLGSIQVLTSQIADFKLDNNDGDFVNEDLDATDIERRVIFLRNKQRIHDAYVQKIQLYQGELRALEPEYADLINQLENIPQIEETERAPLQQHIFALKQLEQFHWKNFLKFTKEECSETVAEYEEDIAIAKEVARIDRAIMTLSYDEAKHVQLQIDYEVLLKSAEAIYTCPACSQTVCVINNELKCAAKDTSTVDTYQKRRLLKVKKGELDELSARAAQFKALFDQRARLDAPEDTLRSLEAQILKWQDYRSKAGRIERLIPSLIVDLPLCDAELRLRSIDLYKNLSDRTALVQKRIDHLTQNVLELEKNAHLVVDCSREIASLSKQLASAELRQKILDERAAYSARIEELDRYKLMQKQITSRRRAMHDLKELITRAEVKYIQESMYGIELLINEYCEALFERPLAVHFILSSESKSTGILKAHLALEIFYKGMKLEGPTMLSGGEYARLNLCISMALAKRFNSKLLLLDEITSQLNQELSEKMLSLLKEAPPCKVLLIAHGVVEGLFDEIIRL